MFSIFPALPENAAKPNVRRRRTRQTPLEKRHLKRKTAFQRFPRTKPDVPSQGLITIGTVRKTQSQSVLNRETIAK